MTAENDVLSFFETELFMRIEHVGPNVFSYDIDKLTPEMLPCIIVSLDGVERTEASTFKEILKSIEIKLEIITGRNNEFYNIKTLYDIRAAVSNVIDAATLPATVIDYAETSAGELSANTDTESNLLVQEVIYTFLTREVDR